MLLGLKSGCVYGPVRSRRLGRSLGINVLPPGVKVCNFDCVYCQYGWTDRERAASSRGFPSVEEVVRAVEQALAGCSPEPEYLTFSGNGEPTLHPGFPELVEALDSVRRRLVPAARLAILSNASRVGDEATRSAIARLDRPILKLDVGSEPLFRRYNGAAPGVNLEQIVEGLRSLPEVTIESLFCGGPRGNAGREDVEAWVELVRRVSPSWVQVYSLARGYPSSEIEPLGTEQLGRIAALVQEHGIRASECY